MQRLFLSAVLSFAPVGSALTTLTVRVDQTGSSIHPARWGVFFEDINFGADGGLHAELAKNRSLEFPRALMGWREVRRQVVGGTRYTSLLTGQPEATIAL